MTEPETKVSDESTPESKLPDEDLFYLRDASVINAVFRSTAVARIGAALREAHTIAHFLSDDPEFRILRRKIHAVWAEVPDESLRLLSSLGIPEESFEASANDPTRYIQVRAAFNGDTWTIDDDEYKFENPADLLRRVSVEILTRESKRANSGSEEP